jgi:hypothetical protein
MPGKLSREIRKLEVRLEGYLGEEEGFVKELRKCIDKFTELDKNLKELKTKAGPEKVEELTNLRLEAIEALSEALKKGSEAEHERSHLLESYGALILAVEREFRDLLLSRS